MRRALRTPRIRVARFSLEMYGQVFCRVRARTLAVDLAGPGETVAQLKARALGGELDRARLTHLGRWLADETSTLAAAGVGPGSTLEATVSGAMRGGGGDGGATGAESRSCYLEMYADGGGKGASRKAESLGGFIKYQTLSTVRDRDEREENLARWFNCTLTEEPLDETEGGVVIDRLGSLFNKEPVLSALRDKALDGAPLPARLEHITGMKAITTLKLHKNAARKSSVKDAAGNVDAASFRLDAEARFSCPVSGLDFNGKTKFFALTPSGLVVSDRALREASTTVDDLLGEELALANQTRIPVNPKGEELEALREALEAEAAKKAAKRRKKDAKAGKATTDENGNAAGRVELVSGTGIKSSAKREWNGCDDLSNEQLKAQAKRFRAADHAPEGADEAVYASLFTGTNAETRENETFLSRNARRGW